MLLNEPELRHAASILDHGIVKQPCYPTGHWKNAVAGALWAMFVGVICWAYRGGDGGLALLSFDLPFIVRPEVTVDDTVIVYMDELSAKNLEQPWTNNVPWNRTVHARLVRRLIDCRVKAIVFDVLFDRTTTEDAVLVDAVRAARETNIPVVVGADLDQREAKYKQELLSPRLPFPELAKVAQAGLAQGLYAADDNDKPRRHSPGFGRLPSMAELTARLTSAPLPQPLPSERWINFYGPPLWLPHRSIDAALDPSQVPNSFFAGKVCFIGALPGLPFPGGKPADEWHTPYTFWGNGKTPGVDINAAVYLNLARNEWLTRLSRSAELLLFLAGGALFGMVLTPFRPTTAAVMVGAAFAAVAAVACWAMWRYHLWFAWLVLGAQMMAALAWSILAHTRRLAAANTALQSSLEELSRGAPTPALGTASSRSTETSKQAEAETSAQSLSGQAQGSLLAIPDHALLRRIGKGAYGEVWLARNVIGTFDAVKVVRRRDFQDAAPFDREFRGIQRFMPISRLHPGLVQILHAGCNETEGFFYYVMEPADDIATGQQIEVEDYSPKSLAHEIQRLGRIPVMECVRIGLRLADGLAFLHAQQLIHRDLKPSNIIFVRGEPKLADIGLVTEFSTVNKEASFVGTQGYIPPEGPGRPEADVFSLGRVLYEACMGLPCGQFPQLPETFLGPAENEQLLELNQIILQACEESLSRRYASAAQMHLDLLALYERIDRQAKSREG